MVVPLPEPALTPEEEERPDEELADDDEPEDDEPEDDEPDEDEPEEDLPDEDLLAEDDEPELAFFADEEVPAAVCPVPVCPALVCAVFAAAEACECWAPTTAAVAVAAVAASAVVQVIFLTRRWPTVLAWTARLKWELVMAPRVAGQILTLARSTSEQPQNRQRADGGCGRRVMFFRFP